MSWLRLIVFCLFPSTALAGWEEISDDDGITVWVQEVKGSAIREVKASAIVDAPAARIWSVLQAVDKYIEFMPYLIEAKVLESDGKTEYQYQLIDPPFVDKRDYVLKVSMDADERSGIYKRQWTTAEGKGPAPREDVVRLSIVKGNWLVEKLTDTQTRITYYLYTDPGGSIPNWIANKANKTSVPDLVNAVRKRAVNPGYKRS